MTVRQQCPVDVDTHVHRKPRKSDFEGKTVKRFIYTADNIFKFFFTDGTSLAIQSDLHYGVAIMEICEQCSKPDRVHKRTTPDEARVQ